MTAILSTRLAIFLTLPPPPRPYLGTDIVKNRDIHFLGNSSHMEVKTRIINQDQKIGGVQFKNGLEYIGSLYVDAKLSKDLCQTHHGHIRRRDKALHAGTPHVVPPDSAKYDFGA